MPFSPWKCSIPPGSSQFAKLYPFTDIPYERAKMQGYMLHILSLWSIITFVFLDFANLKFWENASSSRASELCHAYHRSGAIL